MRVRVLLMVGHRRSGTTLVGNLLNQEPGFFHAGEMHRFWSRVCEGRPSGCQKPVSVCRIWRPIVNATLNGSSPQSLAAIQAEALRGRRGVYEETNAH
jgi:hypothetical protein